MVRQTTAPTLTRNEAIVCVLEAAELTPRELAGLQVADFSGCGELTVPDKNNATRTAMIGYAAVGAVRDWLTWRGNEPGPLFVAWSPAVTRWIGSAPRPLTAPGVYKVLDRLARQEDAQGERVQAILRRLRDSGPNHALLPALTRLYRTPAEQQRQDAGLDVVSAYRGRNTLRDVEEMFAELHRRGL